MMWKQPKTDWGTSDYVNIKDWNRIEENAGILASFYATTADIKTDWSFYDIPTLLHIQRVVENLNKIFECIKIPAVSVPKINTAGFMNDLERGEGLAYENKSELELSRYYAGECYAGDLAEGIGTGGML